MKNFTFCYFVILATVTFLVSGCASPQRGGRRAEPWVNPDTGQVYRSLNYQASGELSEKSIECWLPGDKQPTIVYSEGLCRQLIQQRKIQINQEAIRKVSSRSSIEILEKNVSSWAKACDKIKFKNTKVWCAECCHSVVDKMYCGMNGYY